MQDRELVGMAIFRLVETSNRLASLAAHAESRALSAWLTSLSGQLRDHASRAALIVEAADDADAYGAELEVGSRDDRRPLLE